MFCHRLLRPIADTRTVAEGTDINAMINRGRGADGPARRSPQSARPRATLISAAQPIRSAGRRVFSLTFPVTQRDAVYRRIPALTDPAGYALVKSVEGRVKARFGVPSCITA